MSEGRSQIVSKCRIIKVEINSEKEESKALLSIVILRTDYNTLKKQRPIYLSWMRETKVSSLFVILEESIMKLKISYSFKQQYLPTKRHRKARIHLVNDQSVFDVREIDLDAFPLAFEVESFKSVYNEASESKNNSVFKLFTDQIRTWEGKLYKSFRYSYGAAISTAFLPAEKIERMIGNSVKGFHYEPDCPLTDQSIIVADNKAEVLDRVRSEVDKLLFCEGHFWKKCSEPMYLVLTFGLGHNHGGTGFFVVENYNDNISKENYFNASQRSEAIKFAIETAARRGDTNDIAYLEKPTSNIVVYMPELVQRDPQMEHGDGDPFINRMNRLTEMADSVDEAGLLVMAAAFSR